MTNREDAKKMTAKQKKVAKVMREFKAGTLTSNGKPVKSRQQAIAIAMSEAGMARQGKSDEYWDAYIDAMCGSMSKQGGMAEEEEGEEEGEEEEEEEGENMDAGAAEARCRGYLSSLKKNTKKA